MKITTPLVSARTITYNHAPYIRKCIEGVLMQKVNFPIEYIISEDCSTDGTRAIVLEYAQKFPEMIKVVISDENVGAQANAKRAFEACAGKYIAICEGDDYWTDPYKLQKQVDFLERNPRYSAVGHQTRIITENDPGRNEMFYTLLKKTLSKRDIIYSHQIHTNSIVFRKADLLKYDFLQMKYFYEHSLFILLVQSGYFMVFPEVMSVYRRHDQGMAGISTPEKAYPGQIAWITEVSKILGMRFFWGYHFLSSKVHCHYSLHHPELFVGGILLKTYYFIKFTTLTLILYPRSMKTIFQLLPQFLKIQGKE